MARKTDVRKSISEALGAETAKEFDDLYSKIKQSSGEIRFVEDRGNLIEQHGRYVRLRCDDPERLMETMRREVESLREEATEHRQKYPMFYARRPHHNEHLFA